MEGTSPHMQNPSAISTTETPSRGWRTATRGRFHGLCRQVMEEWASPSCPSTSCDPARFRPRRRTACPLASACTARRPSSRMILRPLSTRASTRSRPHSLQLSEASGICSTLARTTMMLRTKAIGAQRPQLQWTIAGLLPRRPNRHQACLLQAVESNPGVTMLREDHSRLLHRVGVPWCP